MRLFLKILKSDWKRGTSGHIYPKVIAQMLPSINDYLHIKNDRYWLVHSSDLVDQIVLQSEWMRHT